MATTTDNGPDIFRPEPSVQLSLKTEHSSYLGIRHKLPSQYTACYEDTICLYEISRKCSIKVSSTRGLQALTVNWVLYRELTLTSCQMDLYLRQEVHKRMKINNSRGKLNYNALTKEQSMFCKLMHIIKSKHNFNLPPLVPLTIPPSSSFSHFPTKWILVYRKHLIIWHLIKLVYT